MAVIQMLFSGRAGANGGAFLAGWIFGVALVTGAITLVADGSGAGGGGTASNIADLIKMALGAVLFFLAWKQWQARPAAGVEPESPGWMRTIESITPLRAFGLALALSALNPKNVVLIAGAAATIAQAGLSHLPNSQPPCSSCSRRRSRSPRPCATTCSAVPALAGHSMPRKAGSIATTRW